LTKTKVPNNAGTNKEAGFNIQKKTIKRGILKDQKWV
jgi:hypothetical protein